jgi:hypothetical protein
VNVHVDLVCKASSEGDKHVKHVQYCYDRAQDLNFFTSIQVDTRVLKSSIPI